MPRKSKRRSQRPRRWCWGCFVLFIAWLLVILALMGEMRKTKLLQEMLIDGAQKIDVSPRRQPRLAPPTRRQDCPPKLEA